MVENPFIAACVNSNLRQFSNFLKDTYDLRSLVQYTAFIRVS